MPTRSSSRPVPASLPIWEAGGAPSTPPTPTRGSGARDSPRGNVYSYAIKASVATRLRGIEFRTLFVPTALCGAPHRVFVLDEGDTALARDPVSGRVGDLSVTWRVREFGLLGGDTISSF